MDDTNKHKYNSIFHGRDHLDENHELSHQEIVPPVEETTPLPAPIVNNIEVQQETVQDENTHRKRTWNPIFHEWDYEDEQEDPPPEDGFDSPVVSKVWDPIFKDWIYTHADGSVSA